MKIMENNFKVTLEWKNADVYFPEITNEPIIYCTVNDKIGVLKEVKNHWNWLKEKYNIKWWCYQWRILPN